MLLSMYPAHIQVLLYVSLVFGGIGVIGFFVEMFVNETPFFKDDEDTP